MTHKVLSVKQPYAALICAGVKDIENRTWKTDYRGKLLIHASGDSFAYPDFNYLPKNYQKKLDKIVESDNYGNATQSMLNYLEYLRMTYNFYGQDWKKQEPPEKWLKEAVKKHGYYLASQAIIGEVELTDIYDNLHDANSDFAEPDCYYWKLAEPYIYEKPIINVLGHLRIWNYESDIVKSA